MPPLSALRAFEAAARHLSLTRAAAELHVTPGALSHQIRGLEELLGVKLFERRVRAIALTAAGRQLYPGLQAGFGHIRDAVASLDAAHAENILVVSTSPGMTEEERKTLDAPSGTTHASAPSAATVRVASLSKLRLTPSRTRVSARTSAVASRATRNRRHRGSCPNESVAPTRS